MPMEDEELLLKQLPHSVEAEQAVLGSMLIDARCVPEVIDQLRPDDFYVKQNREIYETIYSMFNYSLTIDPVTVLENMKQNGVYDENTSRGYLLQLMDTTPTAANVKEYIGILKDKTLLRRVAETAGELTVLIQQGTETGQDVLEAAEQRIYAIRQGRAAQGLTPISQVLLDVYARLTQAQLRSRREPEKGIFIAESPKVIGHALDAGCVPLSLLMERRQLEGQGRDLVERCGQVPVYTGDRAVLAGLTGYELTRGILCAMRRPRLPSVEELCARASRVAVLEGIVDPTNVGAIFRSAAALHMDAVLVTPTCCDPLSRRAVRVSMGTLFQIPWTFLGTDASQWPQPGLERLKELGFQTAAMALDSTALSIEDPRLRTAEKLAILLGTEGDGLAPRTIAQCDFTVCIPMARGVDSLNVAAASAVAFWELRAR